MHDLTDDLCSHVDDALSKARMGDHLILFDDNIASGKQATKQLRLWMGEETNVGPSKNYWGIPLRPEYKTLMGELELGFAFAVGDADGAASGIANLRAELIRLGLNTPIDGIQFSRSLTEVSGRVASELSISTELREFLRTVGQGLIASQSIHNFFGTSSEEAAAECTRKALGYDNLEGLLVTSFNVPSSTYTALWCPGCYHPPKGDDGWTLPWRPLFIRTEKAADLILF